MAEDVRPDPDALMEVLAREGKGRLKIFFGAAPGVGKTWEMLSAARARRAEGVDVVVGIVETHGRSETAAQIADLPVLSRRAMPYRGQTLEEFDIDAALARHPGLILIDELAHSNVPGSRHAKRWEDVAELLDAGIDVWATLNVQHLESLNDSVARITGVRVTETLPDRVLEMADQIEVIDLPPAELRGRLEEGKVYRADVATRALGGFFREGNLAALRELALRRAAEHVDADMRDYMRLKAIQGPWPAGERVLALVGTDAASEAVVREAKRLGDALHAPWLALHVERRADPTSAPGALALAAQLGAEIEARAGQDVVATALEVARQRNATQIVIGRGQPVLWRRVTGQTFSAALLRQSGAFALHVVAAPDGVARPRRPPMAKVPRQILPWVVAAALVAAVVAVGELGEGALEYEALGMIFIAVVVGVGSLYGLAVALFAAVLGFLSWNFFFIPPLYRLTIYQPRDVVAIVVFLGVAATTGWLASSVRREARVAHGRVTGLRRIAAFSRRLGAPATEPELLQEVARQAADIAGRALVLTGEGEHIDIRASMPPADTMDESGWAAARWSFSRQEEAGRGTATLPSALWRFIPMRTVRGLSGILGVRAEEQLDGTQLQTLSALADQAAVSLERVRLANAAARSAAQAETQKLRTALLNSLSHDLRTPLTGIRGAAETLRTAWGALPPETRADLLASIEQDTTRMTRFLANITGMMRLESGEIEPQRVTVAMAEVIEAAAARVPNAVHLAINIPPDLPPVLADPALLEQVLLNVLDNAVKYSASGAPIRVSAVPAEENLRISVADEGVGINPIDLPHIFDSLYRAERRDRVAPGTGLGLAIARGLVEAMGVSITAESPRPDMPAEGSPGTVITIRLPRG
jgi:two-component system, OmpR family, sensor histidine kinase KdpD